MANEETWTIQEIAKASGREVSWIRKRCAYLQQRGELPERKTEYNYSEVKTILMTRLRARNCDPVRAGILKRQLITDGLARK